MSEAPPDRDEEMLSRLAEFDLAAAERVHGRLMAAEEASDIAELGRTYQRLARSLRQTLALKAKLKRDREAQANAAPAAWVSPPPGGVAVARRLREVRDAVRRVIWNEAEDDDHATLLEEELEERLCEGVLGEGFCAEPLDDHVARTCLELELSLQGAEGWRDLPDPPPPDPGDPGETAGRRSSA
jgi:hypothetical protein